MHFIAHVAYSIRNCRYLLHLLYVANSATLPRKYLWLRDRCAVLFLLNWTPLNCINKRGFPPIGGVIQLRELAC